MNRFEIRFYIDSSRKSIANTIVSANSEFLNRFKFRNSKEAILNLLLSLVSKNRSKYEKEWR